MRLTEELKELLEICDTLKDFEGCKVTADSFMLRIRTGIASDTIFPYVEYNDKKLIACVIFQLAKDLNPGLVLCTVWCWIDPHYPKMHIKIARLADELAKEKYADRILICTQRNEDAVQRRLSKFGYKAKYTLFEKEVI